MQINKISAGNAHPTFLASRVQLCWIPLATLIFHVLLPSAEKESSSSVGNENQTALNMKVRVLLPLSHRLKSFIDC